MTEDQWTRVLLAYMLTPIVLLALVWWARADRDERGRLADSLEDLEQLNRVRRVQLRLTLGLSPAHRLAAIPWLCDPVATAAVLEAAILDSVPHVRRVSTLEHGLTVIVVVRLRWYAFLTLGIFHVIARARTREVVETVAPVGVRVRTVIGW